MRRISAILLVVGLMACEKIGSGGGTSASKPDSITVLNTKLAQAKAVAAQQDSLLQGFQQTTQLLADIDKELSSVKGLKSHVPVDTKGENPNDPQAAYRASIAGQGRRSDRAAEAEPRARRGAEREEHRRSPARSRPTRRASRASSRSWSRTRSRWPR